MYRIVVIATFSILLALRGFAAPIPICPIEQLSPLQEGVQAISGVVFPECVKSPVWVFAGRMFSEEMLGSTTVDENRSFTVHLNRPLIAHETITISIGCDAYIPCTYFDTPPIIPEPTTLLLVGGGLTALGLWVRRLRR